MQETSGAPFEHFVTFTLGMIMKIYDEPLN